MLPGCTHARCRYSPIYRVKKLSLQDQTVLPVCCFSDFLLKSRLCRMGRCCQSTEHSHHHHLLHQGATSHMATLSPGLQQHAAGVANRRRCPAPARSRGPSWNRPALWTRPHGPVSAASTQRYSKSSAELGTRRQLSRDTTWPCVQDTNLSVIV